MISYIIFAPPFLTKTLVKQIIQLAQPYQGNGKPLWSRSYWFITRDKIRRFDCRETRVLLTWL